jgi:hypothetical protein
MKWRTPEQEAKLAAAVLGSPEARYDAMTEDAASRDDSAYAEYMAHRGKILLATLVVDGGFNSWRAAKRQAKAKAGRNSGRRDR